MNVLVGFSLFVILGVQGSNGGGLEYVECLQQYFIFLISFLLYKEWLGFNIVFWVGLLYEDFDWDFFLVRGENLVVGGNCFFDNL